MENWVKDGREKSGLTQEELAEKSGVSRGTICALEKDPQKPTSTKTIRKLADALKIQVAFF